MYQWMNRLCRSLIGFGWRGPSSEHWLSFFLGSWPSDYMQFSAGISVGLLISPCFTCVLQGTFWVDLNLGPMLVLSLCPLFTLHLVLKGSWLFWLQLLKGSKKWMWQQFKFICIVGVWKDTLSIKLLLP